MSLLMVSIEIMEQPTAVDNPVKVKVTVPIDERHLKADMHPREANEKILTAFNDAMELVSKHRAHTESL